MKWFEDLGFWKFSSKNPNFHKSEMLSSFGNLTFWFQQSKILTDQTWFVCLLLKYLKYQICIMDVFWQISKQNIKLN